MRKGQLRGVGGLLHFLASMHDTDDNFNGCTRPGGKDRSEFQTVIHPHRRSVLDRSINDATSGICPSVPRLLTHIQQNLDHTGRKILIKGRPKKKVCEISKRTQTPVTVYYPWWLELHFSVSFRRIMIICV
jgi:hypothetical protein